ncbi:VIR protein [Plasmodium vivax]|uniref:VIR protein n=1 Tax=Plasmodium vivax TaxID=5855 RepID=A0A1G4E9A1_PLAVI|nr:VIR protein [Plasmodium vivax]
MSVETSDTYYNYNDYCHFKSKFEAQDKVTFDIEFIERNPVINTINENVRFSLTHVCKKLKEFLYYIHSNEETNITKCCSYINYYLTDKIQGSVYKQKEDTFAHFKKFLQYDPELKSNECISQMNYMDDGLYKKMKLLYDLYDSYEVLNDRIDFKGDTHFCNDLKDLVIAYNKIIGGYKISESKYLFMELKNIKCLIDKSNLMSKTNCDNDIPLLLLPQEEDGDFLKPCTEMEEAEGEEKTRAGAHESTGESPDQGNRLIENREEVSSPTGHPSLSGTYSDGGFHEMSSIGATPDASPPSVASKTIATTASAAAIFVPSYLMYKFTPTRSLINKLLGRITNIAYNNIREPDLLDNFPHSEHFNSERNNYNISYRPA